MISSWTEQNEASRNKTKKAKEMLLFVTIYNQALLNFKKKIVMKYWQIN